MSSISHDEIIVFSKPACVQCSATYKAMEKLGLTYRVVNVNEDMSAGDYIRSLGYRQVPVVVAPGGSEHWSGFRPDRIKSLPGGGKVVA